MRYIQGIVTKRNGGNIKAYLFAYNIADEGVDSPNCKLD